jgi:hypothetical protein
VLLLLLILLLVLLSTGADVLSYGHIVLVSICSFDLPVHITDSIRGFVLSCICFVRKDEVSLDSTSNVGVSSVDSLSKVFMSLGMLFDTERGFFIEDDNIIGFDAFCKGDDVVLRLLLKLIGDLLLMTLTVTFIIEFFIFNL